MLDVSQRNGRNRLIRWVSGLKSETGGRRLTGQQLSEFTRQRIGAASLTGYLDDGGFPAFLRKRNLQILQELLPDASILTT